MRKSFGFLSALLIVLLISGCFPDAGPESPVATVEPTSTSPAQDTPAPSPTAVAGTAGEDGPLIEWQRSGGIAGICRQLTLYPDGEYIYTDCREQVTLSESRLTPQQMAPFTGLAGQYGSFRWEFEPPKGSADMFMDWYVFNGTGTGQPTEEEMQAINDRLAMLANELATQTAGPDGGIRGTVLIGPNCPGPVREGATECPEEPYQAVLAILDASGSTVAEVQSNEQGEFQVALQPGKYTLKPLSDARYPFAPQQTFEVPSGKYVEVTVVYDTGIR